MKRKGGANEQNRAVPKKRLRREEKVSRMEDCKTRHKKKKGDRVEPLV